MLRAILDRLDEPSTYAGLAIVVGIVSPEAANLVGEAGPHLASIAVALLALVAILKREKA